MYTIVAGVTGESLVAIIIPECLNTATFRKQYSVGITIGRSFYSLLEALNHLVSGGYVYDGLLIIE